MSVVLRASTPIMRLEEAFEKIIELERDQACDLEWNGINLWPLVRQCLWVELVKTDSVSTDSGSATPSVRSPAIFSRPIERIHRYLSWWRFRPGPQGEENIAFISRRIYLQSMPDDTLFDRIVDPLLFCLPNDFDAEKYYVPPWPEHGRLGYSGYNLLAKWVSLADMPNEHKNAVAFIASAAGLEKVTVLSQYIASFKAFIRWYKTGLQFFAGRPKLKTLYVTSWYFPDMMGFIAAARMHGIRVVDVQHGKQGRYQAMYSGWTRIPTDGYWMMPDVFWCWGQPSCDHILNTDSGRKIHRPVVGGFPWLDYYRKYVAVGFDAKTVEKKTKRVLVTLQPRQGGNTEPIPDFLIEFLRSEPVGVQFIFRCHPNDNRGTDYCEKRLACVSNELYRIDAGEGNLYDRFLEATHHITAYSSCCYESNEFGVPTLLFGEDAKAIYADEIASGEFTWIPNDAGHLRKWLTDEHHLKKPVHGRYIYSSLQHAQNMLIQLACTR